MNRQIRRMGLALVALFIAMFAQLNYLQVIRADHLANHPGNSRNAVRDFGQPRGLIRTADGRVVAESVRNPDRASNFDYLRRYPGGSLYGHITGYFSFTFGSTGIERTYNSVLAGHRTALTVKRLQDLLRSKVVTSDVTLTLNDRLQRAAALLLKRRKGSIVVLDPRTGAILVSVSYPSYDPSALASTNFPSTQRAYDLLSTDPDQPLLARAYRQRYPPGSTFKTVTAATGLATKVVSTTQPIYPVLREIPLRFTSRPLRNFGGSACGGDLIHAFTVSCNTSFAQLGLDLGAQRLHDGAQSFGFNRTPPLDVSPGAARSVFPPVDFFVRNDPQLAQGAIGQGNVSATPLQMALVASAIANGGTIREPHFLKEVRDSDGNVVQSEPNNEWLRAVSPEVAATMNQLMVGVVNSGTGTRAAISGVQVAAKTGTAQTGRSSAHAWTIAFAPAEAPTVAVAVLIENQREVSTATGGRIAAPLARQMIESTLAVQAGR